MAKEMYFPTAYVDPRQKTTVQIQQYFGDVSVDRRGVYTIYQIPLTLALAMCGFMSESESESESEA